MTKISALHIHRRDDGSLVFEWIFDDARFLIDFDDIAYAAGDEPEPFWVYTSNTETRSEYFSKTQLAALLSGGVNSPPKTGEFLDG